jgi:hypothetical protein
MFLFLFFSFFSFYVDQLKYTRIIPARKATYGELSFTLNADVESALASARISSSVPQTCSLVQLSHHVSDFYRRRWKKIFQINILRKAPEKKLLSHSGNIGSPR